MTLIDDPAVVASLLKQMEAHLPIPAQVTPEVKHMLRAQKVVIPANGVVNLSTYGQWLEVRQKESPPVSLMRPKEES